MKNKAFSMIEALVATLITAIIIIGLVSVFSVVYYLNSDAVNGYNAQNAFSIFINQVSADVRTANNTNISPAGTVLTLSYESGSDIVWEIKNNKIFRNNKEIGAITVGEDVKTNLKNCIFQSYAIRPGGISVHIDYEVIYRNSKKELKGDFCLIPRNVPLS